jgi:hypothetical protein
MAYLGAGVVALGIVYLVLRAFTSVDPRSLVKAIRYIVGLVVAGSGLILVLGGRWGLGLVLVALGLSAVATGRIGPFDLGGGRRSSGSTSTVRSAWFEMTLDHDSGAMTGRVLKGEQAGAMLDDLDETGLVGLHQAVAADADSLALLEAYLDRRFAGWRENVDGDAAARPRSAPDAGPMTDKQAYEILGLSPGASEAEVRAAHRRLMKRVHPDQGGSTFLAAKINQAKDWLLGKHR